MPNNEILFTEALAKLFDNCVNKKFVRNTVELLNATLTFEVNEGPYIDFDVKKASRKYIENELLWYMSKSCNINDNESIANNPIWKSIATKSGKVNSNYGHKIFTTPFNGVKHTQYEYCLNDLLDSYDGEHSGRQAIMYYHDATMQLKHKDGKHASNDYTCTFNVHCFIRNNELHYCVNMRSNDAIFGLINDFAWHYHIYHKLLRELQDSIWLNWFIKIKPGKIHWHADSLHVYERHYDLLADIYSEMVWRC